MAFLDAHLEQPNFTSRAWPRAKTGSGAAVLKRQQPLTQLPTYNARKLTAAPL